jgi:hypothetical protein
MSENDGPTVPHGGSRRRRRCRRCRRDDPEVTASGRDIVLTPPGHQDEIVVNNDADRPRFFVFEIANGRVRR